MDSTGYKGQNKKEIARKNHYENSRDPQKLSKYTLVYQFDKFL